MSVVAIVIGMGFGLTYGRPLTNFCQFPLKIKGASAVDRHCGFEGCLCMHLVIGLIWHHLHCLSAIYHA